ncbi:hypothetical protein GDO86_000624 [Hymenochirus boettgeri]|uniref:Uncharacterized protein n=1 Tax=Hymenochirus boettgeri TaxID=247094 RepID=A0A8T2KI50_9PIPI|nr:hypothetical protein GDO86_000624 [Hymenochirus boettgeri]
MGICWTRCCSLIRRDSRIQRAGGGSVLEDFETYLQNMKSQYGAVRTRRLSSEANILTPNTESSCDLTTKTKSTSGNDDNTSLDLEWEDEEGTSY